MRKMNKDSFCPQAASQAGIGRERLASRLELIWAPWRQEYVAAPRPVDQEPACFICQGLAAVEDRSHWIVRRTSRSVVILNRYPYNVGHLLVAPQRHIGTLAGLSEEEALDTHRTLEAMIAALDALLQPEGYNVGLNLGRAAGAGLPGHLHWHVVPRWNGDTNFMPVIHNAKVMAQSLDSLWQMLHDFRRDEH
jgi:ATP adenylyltransferase